MDERSFRKYWSHKTDSDHVARPGFDVFTIAAAEIQAFLGRGARSRVLEIGCGAGEVFEHLELDRRSYLGVDFSDRILHTFLERHPGVRVLHGDATTFSVPEQFDFVIVNNVVQYCRPWMTLACLHNLKPMLAPGGKIFLGNVPNRSQRLAWTRGLFSGEHVSPVRWLGRLLRGLAVVALSDHDSIGFWYTPGEVTRLAASAGFECAIFGCVLYPYRFTAILGHRST